MKNKIKLLALPLIALSLTGCQGAGSGTITTVQQNMIFDSNEKALQGSVVLSIGSELEYNKSITQVLDSLPKGTKPEKIEAIRTDTHRLVGKDLISFAYDISKTGSYTYSFEMKNGVFKDYQDENGNLISDAYLMFYFQMYNTSKLKNFTISSTTMQIVCKYDYTVDGKTEEHLVEYPWRFSTYSKHVQTNAELLTQKLDSIKLEEDNIDNITNSKLVFNGFAYANFIYEE